jgi:hypothetical protein
MNRHSDFMCPCCDGLGFLTTSDLLMPWAVLLLVAGVALSLGEWIWHLFAKK